MGEFRRKKIIYFFYTIFLYFFISFLKNGIQWYKMVCIRKKNGIFFLPLLKMTAHAVCGGGDILPGDEPPGDPWHPDTRVKPPQLAYILSRKSIELFDLYFDLHLFLQAATVIG